MQLAIIGLGNPGRVYERTRHNLGHLFVDFIADREALVLKPGKGEFFYAQKDNLLLFKNLTYMNLSGIPVRQIVEQFKIDLENLFICHDDLDLPPYNVKIKFDGGSGGHRGIESCVFHLNSENFYRIKFGIGRPQGIDPRDYVLSNLSEDELIGYNHSFKIAYEGIKIMLSEGIQKGITYVNTIGKGLHGKS
ncbi:MAG: aminoacyl-tRNA hydrolase [Candidatus Hydrothermia bacterium]